MFCIQENKKNGMYDIFLFQRECKLAKLERDKSNKYDNEVLKMSICIRYMQATFHICLYYPIENTSSIESMFGKLRMIEMLLTSSTTCSCVECSSLENAESNFLSPLTTL